MLNDTAATSSTAGLSQAGAQRNEANQESLVTLGRLAGEAEKLALRNQLVQRNLPLVYAITARMGATTALASEDLRQIGSLGLLRAVEAFDPARGRSLSSFAVPYIRGAIQHELRDRHSLMRIPRALWDLRRRATVLQDQRRRLGQPQLAPAELAEALSCPVAQVVEALDVAAVVEMRSLDAPLLAEGSDDGGRTLIDLLPDPASLAVAGAEPSRQADPSLIDSLLDAGGDEARAGDAAGEDGMGLGAQTTERTASEPSSRLSSEPIDAPSLPASQEVSWLKQALLGLKAVDRSLVIGHVCEGRSWAELGRELGLHPRQAQRRTLAVLARLQDEGRRWRDSGDGVI